MALYPICWLYNHLPGADFVDLVDAPVRILVGSEDDYDGGGSACEALLRDLAPSDAAHMSLRIFSGATHIFDSFAGSFEYNDPTANRRQGGIIHVRPDAQARQQARDDLTQFFATASSSNEARCRHRGLRAVAVRLSNIARYDARITGLRCTQSHCISPVSRWWPAAETEHVG